MVEEIAKKICKTLDGRFEGNTCILDHEFKIKHGHLPDKIIFNKSELEKFGQFSIELGEGRM